MLCLEVAFAPAGVWGVPPGRIAEVCTLHAWALELLQVRGESSPPVWERRKGVSEGQSCGCSKKKLGT